MYNYSKFNPKCAKTLYELHCNTALTTEEKIKLAVKQDDRLKTLGLSDLLKRFFDGEISVREIYYCETFGNNRISQFSAMGNSFVNTDVKIKDARKNNSVFYSILAALNENYETTFYTSGMFEMTDRARDHLTDYADRNNLVFELGGRASDQIFIVISLETVETGLNHTIYKGILLPL